MRTDCGGQPVPASRWGDPPRCLIGALVAVWAVVLPAPLRSQGAAAAVPILTAEDAVADLAILRRVLQQGHPALYRYTSPASFDSAFAEVQRSLDASIPVEEFYRSLLPLVALVKCGHTHLNLSVALKTQVETDRPLFPAEVQVLGGVPYIVNALDAMPRSVAGARILSVNGQPIGGLLARLRAATPADAGIASRLDNRLSGWRFSLALATATGVVAPFDVEMLTRDGSLARVQAAGVPLPALQAALARAHPRASSTLPAAEVAFSHDSAIAALTVRRFWGTVREGSPERLDSYFEDAFRQMARRRPAALILDLRDNGGGDDEMGALLASYLMPVPFRYYRDLQAEDVTFSFDSLVPDPPDVPLESIELGPDGLLHWTSSDPLLGVLQPARNHFAGRLLVLMNGGSFSATTELLAVLQDNHRGTFIGQEGGGGYTGDNGGWTRDVVLPYSRLVLELPAFAYYSAVTASDGEAHGVRPDYPVVPTIEDVLAGRDPAMRVAVSLANPDPR